MHRRVSLLKDKMVIVLLAIVCLLLIVVDLQRGNAAENYWIARKPMPRTCWGGAAALNGRIYFFVWNATYEYDTAAGSWTVKTSMPTPREDFAVAAYKNKIYVMGGSPVESCWQYYSGVNEVYDPATDTWETKTDMPTKRGGLCAAVVNGKIYLIAGLEELGTVDRGPKISAVNEVYDPEADAWTTAKPIPVGVCRYACAVVDDKIYIMAGWDKPELLQIYDPKTDTWKTGPSPPVPLLEAAAAATMGIWAPKRIYLIGGRYTNFTVSKIVQVYNPEDDGWIIGADMPTARYATATAVVNDTIYVMGGMEMMFTLNPPYGLTAANEQYIPMGYNPNGLIQAKGTLDYTITLVVAIAAIAFAMATAIIIRKRKDRNKKNFFQQNTPLNTSKSSENSV